MVELNVDLYLKAEHIQEGEAGLIADEGAIKPAAETGFEEDSFEIGVTVRKETYRWTMNKTTQRNLAARWGRDTNKWIGKNISFRLEKQKVRGKDRVVIYADPVE